MPYTLLITFLLASFFVQGQADYWVYFTDKEVNKEVLDDPFAYFSPKAVLRKAQQQTSYDIHDLPVNELYVQQISAVAKVKMYSRWLNAALVETTDADVLLDFEFVEKVEPRQALMKVISSADDVNFQYGSARLQIEQVFGDYLHQQGMTGTDVLIAVFDGGFNQTNNLAVFDAMRNEGRFKGGYSFVNQDSNIYTPGSHGTHVLSVMAAKTEGVFVGTAPDANYWLFMTEDQTVEVNAEEYNWLAAAELSDSLGVDIINSSLGYTTFDPGQNSYTPADLDGQIGVVTQAALFAARKGMLVVNSAGNAGASQWRKVVKPADADSIIAVGAVNIQGNRANFSSMGPTVDGRIKPDVMALGEQAYFVATNGVPGQANGTSLSAPIIAGLAACLRQAYPHHSTENLRQTIIRSAHMFFNPDTLMGFGIPNFDVAFNNVFSVDEFRSEVRLGVYPNPVENTLNVEWEMGWQPAAVRIFDLNGRMLKQVDIDEEMQQLPIDVSHLPAGKYILHLYGGANAVSTTIIKK
jgi:serine protease AprX